MPVLPAVASTTNPPGLISPRFSASRMICRAGRSFTDCPGFMNSALPRIVQPVAAEARLSLISGVLPIAATMSSRVCIYTESACTTGRTLDDELSFDKRDWPGVSGSGRTHIEYRSGTMKRSTDRILTTHVGSLIRPQSLQAFLRAKQAGKTFEREAYDRCLTESVAAIVRRQAEVGIDVVSDGEFGKSISWSQYALERLSGFERRPIKPGANPFLRGADRTRFADFYAELDRADGPPASAGASAAVAVCVGPIAYTGEAEIRRDIANFKAALGTAGVEEGFLPVAAPASVIPDRKNEYYKSEDACLQAIALA